MMTWSVSWSWQAPSRVSAIESVNGHLCVAYGLELVLFNESNKVQWGTKYAIQGSFNL